MKEWYGTRLSSSITKVRGKSEPNLIEEVGHVLLPVLVLSASCWLSSGDGIYIYTYGMIPRYGLDVETKLAA